MLRLAPHRPFPVKVQPGEVAIDRRLEFGPRPGGIDVFDAQEEAPAAGRSKVMVEDRRQRMTEMQKAIRARRKSEDTTF